MKQETKLKIGEFSQMMQVTVKTLRHYEKRACFYPMKWTNGQVIAIIPFVKCKS